MRFGRVSPLQVSKFITHLREHYLIWHSKSIYIPLFVFLFIRIPLFFIVYLGLLIKPPYRNPALWRAFPNCLFLEGWARWDSGWYFSIVVSGYNYMPGQQSNVSFFPLYPILIRLLNPIFGNIVLTAIIIANLCFLLSLVVLYKLVIKKFNDENTAIKTLIFIVLYPFSFFFSAAYSESLFLLLVLLSFYFSENKKWEFSSIFAMLAAVTRVVGLALLPAFLLKYLKDTQFNFKNVKADIFCFLFIPIGLLSYILFLYLKFGEPLAFLKSQQMWGRHLFDFSSHIFTLKHLLSLNYKTTLHFFYLILTLVFTGLLLPIYRFLGISYAITSFLFIFIPFITGIESMGRYLSVVFPCFIMMGYLIRSKFISFLIYTIFAILLINFSIFFARGGWVI